MVKLRCPQAAALFVELIITAIIIKSEVRPLCERSRFFCFITSNVKGCYGHEEDT